MLQQVILPLVLSGVGIIVGVLGYLVLFVGYGNPDVGFWSTLASIFAGACFHLHWVTGRESLETCYTTRSLRAMMHTSFICGVVSLAGFIWYIFLTIYHDVPSPPVSENTVIKAVWALICGKWCFTQMYYSNKYEMIIRERPSSILGQDSA